MLEENSLFKIEKVDNRIIENTEYEITIADTIIDSNQSNDISQNSNFKKVICQSLTSDVFALTNIAKNIKDGELYKVVGNKSLQQLKNGNYSGIFRNNNGTISGHAQFQQTGINYSQLATTVLSQSMLIHIAMKLEKLEEEIKEIKD